MQSRVTPKSRRHLNMVVRKRWWWCWMNSDSFKSHLLSLDVHAPTFVVIVTGVDPYSHLGFVMPKHISAQVSSVTTVNHQDSLVCIQ